jgi:Mlc titration factor MtfA (ptsG expression regulator)
MSLLRKFENWRVLSALKKHPVHFPRWRLVRQLACIRYLSPVEKARLRVLTSVLLGQKIFAGEQGLTLSDDMCLVIAAQACVPVLKLGLNYYAGFVQVSVYPDAFWVERDERDEMGIMHHKKALLSGESWSRGPVILSWQDIDHDMRHDQEGHNVIIHEFAHKIDSLNRGTNGMPPMVSSSSAEEWHAVFQHAYQHLQAQVEQQHKTCINAYGATSPSEFFAVVSEYFFTDPLQLSECYPAVYQEMQLFYRQDPVARIMQSRHTII